MSSYAEVVVLVEGRTEQLFVKEVLAPYLVNNQVYITPIILDKKGEKGGDIKFSRAKRDIGKHLKQRKDTWLTLLVDYYGIRKDWPGYAESKQQNDHNLKAKVFNDATAEEIRKLLPKQNPELRFIPYVSMHEIEALYFSDPASLAEELHIDQGSINTILKECGEPEKINDNKETAPSKRLEQLSDRFKKTSTGISIAKKIGIPKIREACLLFDAWLTKLENLAHKDISAT